MPAERRQRTDDRHDPYERYDNRPRYDDRSMMSGLSPDAQAQITQAAIQAATIAAAQAAATALQAQQTYQPPGYPPQPYTPHPSNAAARPGGPPGPRPGGAGGGGGGGAPMPAAVPGQPYFVKVSSGSNPKSVAGKVCHTCREGDAPAMLTIGSSCINQAVKAVCISRGYLARDARPMEISFQTAFREGGTPDKPSVALYLAKHPITWAPTANSGEMQVSASSAPHVVAGALANRVRDGSVPSLTAIGVDAVANCVLAIGQTRLYLEKDGRDVRALPEFIRIKKNGEDWNAIKFHIHVDVI